MKKVTAITLFQTAAGYRISMVHSEIDEKGNIVKDNYRTDRILVDQAAIAHTDALMEFAQSCIDETEG